jgi:hypothetical protein
MDHRRYGDELEMVFRVHVRIGESVSIDIFIPLDLQQGVRIFLGA